MTEFKLLKTYAALPRTMRGQPMVINGDPKGENILYCCGSNVYVRNIKDTSICYVYTEHAKETSVAKYSPSRFYIASGDATGKVRVWDTVNEEHILKIEHDALRGTVKDIDWTADSQKLAVVGEGREKFGRVFTFDSGNSVGEITGHSKSINSVAVRQSRPFRIVTGSEDFTSVFYEGPPFKFNNTKSDHTNFVNVVRYQPNGGDKFVTGGSDGKLFVYDGKTSELIGEMGEPKAHKGGIYSMCFNDDGTKLLTVSGDKTAKIWDVESKSVETEFELGKTVDDMQVGCLWQGDNILTVSLSGFINYLDPASPTQPARILKGHSRPVMALAVSSDASQFYSSGTDFRIVRWDAATSECDHVRGKGHTNQVIDLKVDAGFLISVGMDDMVIFTPLDSMEYNGTSIKLNSQPKALDSRNGIAVVASINHVTVLQAPGRTLFTMNVKEAMSVSISPDGTLVAVGSKTRLHVYRLENSTLTEWKMEKLEEVESVEFSPDGAWLAVSSMKTVRQYSVPDWQEVIGIWGEQHTARVINLSWSPDSRRFVSSGIDSFLIVWENGKFSGRKPGIRAHAMSFVNKVRWLSPNTLISAGQDANIKLWSLSD